MREAGRKTGRRRTCVGGLAMENRSLLLKISINFSAHMDKDRKKNRNRSNLTTAAIQYPDEFWFEACGGGH